MKYAPLILCFLCFSAHAQETINIPRYEIRKSCWFWIEDAKTRGENPGESEDACVARERGRLADLQRIWENVSLFYKRECIKVQFENDSPLTRQYPFYDILASCAEGSLLKH